MANTPIMMAAVSSGFERFSVDMIMCFVVGVNLIFSHTWLKINLFPF